MTTMRKCGENGIITMIKYLVSYALTGMFLMIFLAIPIRFGATEDGMIKFAEEHRGIIGFLQAYMAYRIIEWM